MIDIDELTRNLKLKLPSEDQKSVDELVKILVSISTSKGNLTPDQVKSMFGAKPEVIDLLKKLAGVEVTVSGTTSVSFGKDNQFGDITVHDVAARDINYHITNALNTVQPNVDIDKGDNVAGGGVGLYTIIGGIVCFFLSGYVETVGFGLGGLSLFECLTNDNLSSYCPMNQLWLNSVIALVVGGVIGSIIDRVVGKRS